MERMDKHDWISDQGHRMRAENGQLWAVGRHTKGKYLEVESIVGDIAAREIQRLAAQEKALREAIESGLETLEHLAKGFPGSMIERYAQSLRNALVKE